MNRLTQRREAALDLYNAVIGAFLFVSPFMFAMSGAARNDAFASGAIVVIASLLAIVAFKEWEEWVNLAIGLWLIASPYVLHFPHHAGTHVALFVGGVLTFLSLLELWLVHNPGWMEFGPQPQGHPFGPQPHQPDQQPDRPLSSP